MPQETEEDIKVRILQEACAISPGTANGYPADHVANELAAEMIADGLLAGNVTEHGTACIMGIRDAGRQYLASKTPLGKVKGAGQALARWGGRLSWLAAGYILGLDVVRTKISNILDGILK